MKLFTLSNYIIASHAFLAVYLFYAFSNHDNFYAAMQSLAVQKPAVVAIYNYCFILFLGLCELIMLLFFGQLRHMEIEQVMEQGRGFFMDAVLFLVLSKPLINGREIDTLKLLKCLCCLIALKGYHLVLFIRSLHIFQTGIPKITTILRNLVVMYILTLTDISLIFLFYSLSTGKSTFYMWLLFECIGMFQGVISCILKYMINLADIILIHGLSQKPTYLFYLDLLHDFISLMIFIAFMTIFFLLNPTSLPLYMVVDVMQVIRNLAGRMATLFKYRKLTKIIELRFPNATAEQAETQDTCIICREKLDETCKSLDCSHVFHYQCLKSWLIHQISCPLCRKEIVYMDPFEVVEEMYLSGDTDILLKKIIETDTNRDPFEEFNLYLQGNIHHGNDGVNIPLLVSNMNQNPLIQQPITLESSSNDSFSTLNADYTSNASNDTTNDKRETENATNVEKATNLEKASNEASNVEKASNLEKTTNEAFNEKRATNLVSTVEPSVGVYINDLKETYQSMIVSVDLCLDLINKYNALDPQPLGFESALEVISLDQFERYILVSELPEYTETPNPNDNYEEGILANACKFEKKMNSPLKLVIKPYIASILGYRMRVIDSMVRAVKTIISSEGEIS